MEKKYIYITAEPLFKNSEKKIHFDRRHRICTSFFNVIMQVCRKCHVLSEQASDSHLPSYITYVFYSMYSTVNSIFHFSYSDPDYLTSGLTVTGLVRGLLYVNLLAHYGSIIINIHRHL
jgi:hypothetical protein